MREILFRGKLVDNGEWVDGYLFECLFEGNKYPIILQSKESILDSTQELAICFPKSDVNLVHNESVGQFTGQLDKNGVKIFEGDIVSSPHWNPSKYEVMFLDGEFCFTREDLYGYTNSIHYLKDFEVIGNIYDNPELIK